MTKATDIRLKADAELQSQLQDLSKEAMNLRFQKAAGSLENTSRIRQVRREEARIQTILNERLQGKTVTAKAEKPKAAPKAKSAAKTTKVKK